MKKLMMLFAALLAAPLYAMEGDAGSVGATSFEDVDAAFLMLAAEPLEAEDAGPAVPRCVSSARVASDKPLDLTKVFNEQDAVRLVAAVDEKMIAYCTALLKQHGEDAVLFGPGITDMSTAACAWRAILEEPATSCLLVCLGANPAPASRAGKTTALHLAALRGDHATTALLLGQMSPESIAGCNRHGHTALHLAAREGHTKCVALLLLYMSREAINLTDGFGYAAIDLASRRRIKNLIAAHLSKRG